MQQTIITYLISFLTILSLAACSGDGYGDLDYEKKVEQEKHNQRSAEDIYDQLTVVGKLHYNYVGETFNPAIIGEVFVNPEWAWYSAKEPMGLNKQPDPLHFIYFTEEWRDKPKELFNAELYRLISYSGFSNKIIRPNILQQKSSVYSTTYNSSLDYRTYPSEEALNKKKCNNQCVIYPLLEGITYAGYITPEEDITKLAKLQKTSQVSQYRGNSYGSNLSPKNSTDNFTVQLWVDWQNNKFYGKYNTYRTRTVTTKLKNGKQEYENIDFEADITDNTFVGKAWGWKLSNFDKELAKYLDKTVLDKQQPAYLEGQFNGPNADEISFIFYDPNLTATGLAKGNEDNYSIGLNSFSQGLLLNYDGEVDIAKCKAVLPDSCVAN